MRGGWSKVSWRLGGWPADRLLAVAASFAAAAAMPAGLIVVAALVLVRGRAAVRGELVGMQLHPTRRTQIAAESTQNSSTLSHFTQVDQIVRENFLNYNRRKLPRFERRWTHESL